MIEKKDGSYIVVCDRCHKHLGIGDNNTMMCFDTKKHAFVVADKEFKWFVSYDGDCICKQCCADSIEIGKNILRKIPKEMWFIV